MAGTSPEDLRQGRGRGAPGPGGPGSRLAGHSPSLPLVPLGLELRLVLEYPGEVREPGGEGPDAEGSPGSPPDAWR